MIRCRFCIDLVVDASRIPFRLKLENDKLTFDSKTNNHWQDEVVLRSNPWTSSVSFAVMIVITRDDGFRVGFVEKVFQIDVFDRQIDLDRIGRGSRIQCGETRFVSRCKNVDGSRKFTRENH